MRVCTFPGVPERSGANRAQESAQAAAGGARDSVKNGATELEWEVTYVPLQPHSLNVTR